MQGRTHSPQETEAFAKKLAAQILPGDCIAFEGEMGAGKTAFVRGLAEGMKVEGEVCSPTFALVHEYPGRPALVHFDMYRIQTEDDLLFAGFFDALETDAVVAVEWSENVREFLPENAIVVRIVCVDENTREITVSGGTL